MRKLLIVLTVLLTLSGCGGKELVVTEESSIPDDQLQAAYTYAVECVNDKMETLGSPRHKTIEDMMLKDPKPSKAIIAECLDNMFIVYGESEYSLIEPDSKGTDIVICRSSKSEEIIECEPD